MNLFLLLAVPLFAVILWRRQYPETTWADVVPTAAFSLVWALILLSANILLSSWVIDNGNPWMTALGDLVVSGILIPGAVLMLHLVGILSPKAPRTAAQKQGDIALFLAVVLSAVGFGEFLASSRQSGLWELFLLPLLRMIWLVGLPWLAGVWLTASKASDRNWGLAGLILLASGVPLLHALWLNDWGWLTALVELGLALGLLFGVLELRLPKRSKKNAAPMEGGESASS